MKELFYGILSVLLIANIFYIWKNPPTCNITKYNGGVIVSKHNYINTGETIDILMPSDSIYTVRVHQIIYDYYKIGETIKQ